MTDRQLRAPTGSLLHRGDSFHYNDTGELTTAQYRMSVNGQGQFASPERTVTYQVDKAGNRKPDIAEQPGGVLGYVPNVLNQYTTANGAAVSNGPQHEISGYDAVTYRYVADQRLASAMKGSNRYELGYDALGRCVRRTSNGATTFYIYDGERPIVEVGGNGAILAKNVYGIGIDEILSRDTGTIYYYHQDRLGNVVAITNSAGYVEEQYSYDAFGTPAIWGPPETTNPRGQSRTGTLVGNRFLFTGREWAATYGFYEYRNRAYHPGLGRFMSEDPLGFKAGDRNLFRYCGGDPVNRVDPMGLTAGASDQEKSKPSQIDWRWKSARRNDSSNRNHDSYSGAPAAQDVELKVEYAGYPEKGRGGRPVVEKAIETLRSKSFGRSLLRGRGTLTIRPTDKNHTTGIEGYKENGTDTLTLYLNPKDELFYDPETYRRVYKSHPEEKPPIDKNPDAARASVIGHELGHRFDGPVRNEVRTVIDYENKVRAEHFLPPRRSYGGDKFRIDD